MAISRTSRNTINTFSRFDNTSAGISTTPGAFALQAGSSATHYVSSDGLTWTANALSNSFSNFNWCLYSSRLNTWVFSSSTPNYVVFNRSASFTGKVRSHYNGSWAIGNTFQGQTQWLDTGVDLLWGNGGGWITDMNGLTKWIHPNTGFSVSAPAWDGASTYAIVAIANTSTGYYSTGDSTSGSGIMPYANGASGQNGWSNWSTFSTPTTSQWFKINYYNGYWYLMNTSGVVYYTSNIATASPSWTNQGTVLYSPFYEVNGELWLIPYWSSGTTAYRLTSGAGSWTAITLPANKQCTGIAYGNGVYVIACSDGTVHRSTTGASGSFSNVSTGAASTTVFGPSTIGFGAA